MSDIKTNVALKIAVLGCGNMAQAIVKGALAGGNVENKQNLHFYTYTPSMNRAEDLAAFINEASQTSQKRGENHLGIHVKHLSELPLCDYYLIACKPQQVRELGYELKKNKHTLTGSAVVLSLLAGTTTQALMNFFKTSQVVRIMPNTPCRVGAGLLTMYFSPTVAADKRGWIESFFHQVGAIMVFDQEQMIDQTTGVSGSGPAYVFEWARILEHYLINHGLDQKNAVKMVKATLFGAVKLLNESSHSFTELRDQVTSKGGVTFEGLKVLSDTHLEENMNLALAAAHRRGRELALESEQVTQIIKDKN